MIFLIQFFYLNSPKTSKNILGKTLIEVTDVATTSTLTPLSLLTYTKKKNLV
jgi:hypothetical protein